MKLKKVALLSLTLIIFCLSVVLPVKAASPYNWKKYNYFVEDDVLYSMDGSTDIVVNEGDNVKVYIGSKVVLDSKEDPYKTTYIADPGREFGSENLILTNGKKGVVERWYNMEPIEPADRDSLKVDVLDKFELGKNVRYRITFKNDFDFTMRGVVLKCWLDSYTDHISNDKGGVNDSEDPKGIWFWFEDIKPGETIIVNGLVKCVKALPDGIKPGISARIMTMKRPAFKEATPGFIAMNTKEAETQQKVDEVISVGTKPKTEHVVIPHKKLEPKAGFEIIPGKDGSKDVVTTYTVDKQTGKVTPKTEEKNLVKPVDEQYRAKQTNKPTETVKPTERVKVTKKTATEAKPSSGKTVINNNVNQVAIKKLPNTEAAKSVSLKLNKILLVAGVSLIVVTTATFLYIFTYKKVYPGKKDSNRLEK